MPLISYMKKMGQNSLAMFLRLYIRSNKNKYADPGKGNSVVIILKFN
jgi:hypothetical protein